MKDVFGYELYQGDAVAFNLKGYIYKLYTGVVVGFTSHKVKIRTPECVKYILKFPEQLAKHNR